MFRISTIKKLPQFAFGVCGATALATPLNSTAAAENEAAPHENAPSPARRDNAMAHNLRDILGPHFMAIVLVRGNGHVTCDSSDVDRVDDRGLSPLLPLQV
jgi:hypothetical protein